MAARDRVSIARGYSRVSSERQYQSHLSLESQQAECERYYEWRIKPKDPSVLWEGMYSDDRGVSSKIPTLRRKAAIELDRRLNKGDHVIMPKVDRAWRNMRDAVAVIHRWQGMGVHIHFASEGICISDDPEWASAHAVVYVYMMTICAEMERNRISERAKDAYAARRARGDKTVGNHPKWGKKRAKNGLEWEDNDREIAVMQMIVALRDEQKYAWSSISLLCDKIADLRSCSRWHIRTIQKIYARAKGENLAPSLRFLEMVREKGKQKLIPKGLLSLTPTTPQQALQTQ